MATSGRARDFLAEVGLPSTKLWHVVLEVPKPSGFANLEPLFLTYAGSVEDVVRRLPTGHVWRITEIVGELVSLDRLEKEAKKRG